MPKAPDGFPGLDKTDPLFKQKKIVDSKTNFRRKMQLLAYDRVIEVTPRTSWGKDFI